MPNLSLRLSAVFFFLLSCLSAAAQQASPQGGNTPDKDHQRMAANGSDGSNAGPCINRKLTRYRASANSTGETVEGGVCVGASPANRLRNVIYISTTVTQTAGPSPTTIFPSSGEKSLPSGLAPATLSDLEGRIAGAENLLRQRQDDNRIAAGNMDGILARLKEFVVHSDESATTLHYDGTTGQSIVIRSYDEQRDRFVYHNPWLARSLLCKENNMADVEAQSEGKDWSVTAKELERVIFVSFVFPDLWARLHGVEFDAAHTGKATLFRWSERTLRGPRDSRIATGVH